MASEVMIRIKILKNMSESLEKQTKKRNPVSGRSGREHPHVK